MLELTNLTRSAIAKGQFVIVQRKNGQRTVQGFAAESRDLAVCNILPVKVLDEVVEINVTNDCPLHENNGYGVFGFFDAEQKTPSKLDAERTEREIVAQKNNLTTKLLQASANGDSSYVLEGKVAPINSRYFETIGYHVTAEYDKQAKQVLTTFSWGR